MKRFGFASFVLVMGMALPAAAQFDGSSPQGPLNAAKDLYASARYDEALSVLNGLRIGESVDRKSVEQYRSLCLLALGRASEAETAIEAVVTADPTYRPGESESPRVRATFTVVRKRLLPEITTAHYQAAKAAYDRKEWAASEHQFRTVLDLIDDPDTGGRLGDLRVLAVGFLELSARAAAAAASTSGRTEADVPRAGQRAAGGDGRFRRRRGACGPHPREDLHRRGCRRSSSDGRPPGDPERAAERDGDGQAARPGRGRDRRAGSRHQYGDARFAPSDLRRADPHGRARLEVPAGAATTASRCVSAA